MKVVIHLRLTASCSISESVLFSSLLKITFRPHTFLGVYDFPQKNYKKRIQNSTMLFLSKSSAFRKEVNNKLKKEMIKPLQKELGT